jgi:hypothetical protein
MERVRRCGSPTDPSQPDLDDRQDLCRRHATVQQCFLLAAQVLSANLLETLDAVYTRGMATIQGVATGEHANPESSQG